MPSRFGQLLLLCLLVVFLPTLIYLWPASATPRNQYGASDHQWYGAAGSVPGSGKDGATTQGKGPMAQDHGSGWMWPDSLVDPARLKAGDYWKSWKDSWKKTPAGTSAPAKVLPAAAAATSALPQADGTGAFAAKMGNETAKAELGRATWRFLHTMTLRFPDHPTPEQRQTLSTFIHTFSLLYPCGECANHFQALLKELPPQTSSRMAASLWLCSAHNQVNARLGKPEFPCDKLDATYDCGCGPTPPTSSIAQSTPTASADALAAPLPQPLGAGSKPPVPDWLAQRSDSNDCGLCQVRGDPR